MFWDPVVVTKFGVVAINARLDAWFVRTVGVVAAGAVVLLGTSAPPAAAVDEGAGRYVPVAPSRVLDTRIGLGAPQGRPAPGAKVDLMVLGAGGVPLSGVSAVTFNVTVTNPRQIGFVQVLPTGSPTLGQSSNINVYGTGQTVANFVTVPVGAGGKVTFYDVVGGDLIADVQGYFATAASSADGRYHPVAPTRLIDSRNRTGMPSLLPPNPGDTKNCASFATWTEANTWFWTYYRLYGDVAGLDGDNDLRPCVALPGNPGRVVEVAQPDYYPRPAPRTSITLQVTGSGGVPASGASAVALSVTATNSAGPGFAQVVPTGGSTALGATSNINLTGPGQTVANLVIVPLGTGGAVQLYNSSGTDLIADVVGYFTDATAAVSSEGLFVPATPSRLWDTRASGAVAGSSETKVTVGGLAGLPTDGMSAVFFNATVTGTTGPGYLQLFPTGQGTPGSSSNVNYTGPNQTVATAVIGGLGSGGRISVFTPTRTNVILDVAGYFTDSSTEPVDPALAGLTIAPKNTSAIYDRDDWQHWIDADDDCQNTRAEVLIAESLTTAVLDAAGCAVVTGTWLDPYTGQTWFDASDVDIDHMVPLKNADESGGWAWDAAKKTAYANDLTYADHLIGVEDNINAAKGSSGPESWKPPSTDDWCNYATDWATIKTTWQLTVTQAEYDALADMLTTC